MRLQLGLVPGGELVLVDVRSVLHVVLRVRDHQPVVGDLSSVHGNEDALRAEEPRADPDPLGRPRLRVVEDLLDASDLLAGVVVHRLAA